MHRSWFRVFVAFTLLLISGRARADDPARVSVQPQPQAVVAADHARRMQAGLKLFKERVRPILTRSCLDCHGGKATKGNLDLSDRAGLVESGVLEEGRLVALVAHTDKPHMPMKAPRLPEAEVDAIRRWVEFGAPYDRPLIELSKAASGRKAVQKDVIGADARNFWSFRALKVVTPPEVRDEGWARTPIDRFILAKLESKGIAPNREAGRRVLIRRLSFDLVGLPPSPEEVDAFEADRSPEAYERLVDRLLASKGYGERWARHWMDVARFAESHGYEQDYDRPYAYVYRDWLIRALNDDMPYDRFVRWQIAGDELAPGDPWASAATGFLGAGAFPTQLTEAEFESARYDELDDMTSTTSLAFLGLSAGCARCHDHKYDPIPSEDYYRMVATFATTIRAEVELPLGDGSKPTKAQITSEGLPHTKHHADDRGFPHFYAKTYVLNRGDVHQKKAEAAPGFLRVLTDPGVADAFRVDAPSGWTRTSFRRAGLARWLTDVERGAGRLAARVIVNRLWQHHFGRGLVATPNDFGAQGERPTHPELLEWLALDLIHNGWRLKRLQKLMVTSAVYRQDGRFDEARGRVDREDELLWRYSPRRLEAEPIHDAMLDVAGLLDRRMGGPATLDPNMTRRAVYFFIKRSQLIPSMMLFDWPEHLVSIGRRGSTTTAPQALMFMNSPLTRRCAEGLSRRAGSKTAGEAIQKAYKIAFGRAPDAAEAGLATSFLTRQAAQYRAAGAADADARALVDLCQSLMSMSEFIYVQ